MGGFIIGGVVVGAVVLYFTNASFKAAMDGMFAAIKGIFKKN